MIIKIKFFSLLIFAMTIASCTKKTVEKPNVILVMADDMGYECLGINGATEYNTPELDELGRKGINVTNCIAQPLCTPSRVKIMTGMYNYRNYESFEYLNPENYTIGELMKDAGYNTAIAGKWQLNGRHFNKPGWEDLNRPFEFGFDSYCLWQVTKPKAEGERFADPLIYKNGEKMTGLEDAYGPDVFTGFILDFMDDNKDDPFFIYYPMVLVHDPFVPTPDSKAWDTPERRYENDTSYFKEMVEYTDKIIGKIVNKLEETGLRKNTLLIFTGDNGTHPSIITDTENGPYKGGKGKLFDPGTRVPLVMSWPGKIKKPLNYDGLVEFSDFFPTLADLAGIEVQSDGKSLLPLIYGKVKMHRETAFVHYNPRWGKFQSGRFVRTGDYKLYSDGKFYNLVVDPLEKNPLETAALTGKSRRAFIKLQEEMDKHPDGDVVNLN